MTETTQLKSATHKKPNTEQEREVYQQQGKYKRGLVKFEKSLPLGGSLSKSDNYRICNLPKIPH